MLLVDLLQVFSCCTIYTTKKESEACRYSSWSTIKFAKSPVILSVSISQLTIFFTYILSVCMLVNLVGAARQLGFASRVLYQRNVECPRKERSEIHVSAFYIYSIDVLTDLP